VHNPGEIRRICALIACMPRALQRENYIQALISRSGFNEHVLRRDINGLINSGRAVAVTQGNPDAPAVVPSDTEEGWWNRDQGEGEDAWEYFYRRHCRMRIVRHLIDWLLFDQWAALTDDILRDGETTLFAAEWRAWEQIRESVVSDPAWKELQGQGSALDEDEGSRHDRIVDEWETLLARISLLAPDERLGPIIDRAEEVAEGYKSTPGWEWIGESVIERLDQIWEERTRGDQAAALEFEEGR
jgi:hypothetical protein